VLTNKPLIDTETNTRSVLTTEKKTELQLETKSVLASRDVQTTPAYQALVDTLTSKAHCVRGEGDQHGT
jgi:hypothetical protein